MIYRQRFLRVVVLLAFFVMALQGCSVFSTTPVAWSRTPTPIPTDPLPSKTAVPLPTYYPPTPAITPTPTSSNPGQLMDRGPWLVYASANKDTIHVVNGNGTGHLDIPLPEGTTLLNLQDLQNGASLGGQWLAVRIQKGEYDGLALGLIHLPDGAYKTLTPLLAAALEQQIREADPARRPEAGIAVTQPEALNWSPNGRYLAFIAALDAVSSDLYVYDTIKETIQRMSENSRQAAKPMWSPDSQFVVAQDVETFNYEDGWLGTGVKAYAVTREDVRRLYGPAVESTGENYLPWEDAQIFGVYTHTANGNKAVREVNLERRREEPLYQGIFDQVAFDPQTRKIVFTESQNTARFSYFPLGLYMVSPGTDPISIQSGTWSSVLWDQKSQRFYARGGLGVLVMDTSGQFSLLPGEGTPAPSPDGMWLACWGSEAGAKSTGIHLYKSFKTMLQAITTAPVEDFSWKPDSQGVVYASENSLYMATFPLLQPQLVGENIAVGAPKTFGWVDTGAGN